MMQQGAVQAAQNNLLTIYGAEKNYYFNNAGYCINSGSKPTCADTLTDINTNLSLNVTDNYYSYVCSAGAAPNPFCCTATNNSNGQVLSNPSACSVSCTPNCNGVTCGGSNGCGGTCQTGGGCTPACTPNCNGVTCGGANGCGGTCQSGGGCTPPCTPNCNGVTCGGADGCGGTCQAGGGCLSTSPCSGSTPCGTPGNCYPIPNGVCDFSGNTDQGCGCGEPAPDTCGQCGGTCAATTCGCIDGESIYNNQGNTCGSTLTFDGCGIRNGSAPSYCQMNAVVIHAWPAHAREAMHVILVLWTVISVKWSADRIARPNIYVLIKAGRPMEIVAPAADAWEAQNVEVGVWMAHSVKWFADMIARSKSYVLLKAGSLMGRVKQR